LYVTENEERSSKEKQLGAVSTAFFQANKPPRWTDSAGSALFQRALEPV
jgi:hypothetical protein